MYANLFYQVRDREADDPESASDEYLRADELKSHYPWLPEFVFNEDFHKLSIEFGLRQIEIELDRGPVVITEHVHGAGEPGDVQ